MSGIDAILKADEKQELAGTVENGAPLDDAAKPSTNGEVAEDEDTQDENQQMFQLNVKLPHPPGSLQIMVSTQDQVQDIRQSIIETVGTFQYSCFHLEHKGERINDFVELSDVPGIAAESEIDLVEDPYTEKEARLHVIRIREIIGAAAPRSDLVSGISAGLSLFDSIETEQAVETPAQDPAWHPLKDFKFDAPGTLETYLPPTPKAGPKTIKSISVSQWNPPPHHLRQRGHLLYIQVCTLEGEQFHITGHVSGFYVNKSSSTKFDPSPRLPPQKYSHSAHSLLALLGLISPSFSPAFQSLLEHNAIRDPLSTFPPSNYIPVAPAFVPPTTSTHSVAHQADQCRNHESYLIAGAENNDSLRDWNEEFQSTRELPQKSVAERVFRERLLNKLHADYTVAAAQGACMISRGEVSCLNPTEGGEDAKIYVYNNIFFSHGADGVGTFAQDGGDEAARVATGKDVAGVRFLNGLDINGLSTPATVAIDYLGRRIVAQSIIPGIFKQREPEEHQIDYGGVEGRDVVATSQAFVEPFTAISKAMRIKTHPVWDKEGKRHDLVASVETKGLLGTDGRKYGLDLYRCTPLDVAWLEKYWRDLPQKPAEGEDKMDVDETAINPHAYPHRMACMRQELVEAFWKFKMREWLAAEVKSKGAKIQDKSLANGESEQNANEETTNNEATNSTEENDAAENEKVDLTKFEYALNPDVFSGQRPQTDEEKEEMERDEQEVRACCAFLTENIIPAFIRDLREGEVGAPMDSSSLSRLMHKRGINMRYLGSLASHAIDMEGKIIPRLEAMRTLCVQEMVIRASKHVLRTLLRKLPAPMMSYCVSHFFNCLLGTQFNESPESEKDDLLWSVYGDKEACNFQNLTPADLKSQIETEIRRRYQYELKEGWREQLKHLQVLRDLCLVVGLQLKIRSYSFTTEQSPVVAEVANGINGHSETNGLEHPAANGTNGINGTHDSTHLKANGTSKKKKSPAPSIHETAPKATFVSDDILNFVPIIKDSAPRSALAEEALEAGRISILQDQKELGQELLMESLSLHEQIYGILHPEVARAYSSLAMIYYQLENKQIALELARKAAVTSERTLGVDNSETILCYLNLGLFEHSAGNTRTALSYIRHALLFWRVVFGPSHPDSVTTMNNVAVMLQSLKLFTPSREWFQASHALCESVFGHNSAHTATLCFQLAQAQALDQDPKGAVKSMKRAYNGFLADLGESDRHTREAESWLRQLTSNAVALARQEQDQDKRLAALKQRRGPTGLAGITGGNVRLMGSAGGMARPQAGVGEAAADHMSATGIGRVDERSIEELLKFIEGSPEKPKRKAPRGGRKGRGMGAAVAANIVRS